MIDRPIEIEDSNLSHAWGRAFLRTRAAPRENRLGPLVVSITGFENGEAIEDPSIREAVDQALSAADMRERRGNSGPNKKVFQIEECASTIFPRWRWYRHANPSSQQFFAKYAAMYPRLIARHPANTHGTYFGRMTQFRGLKGNIDAEEPKTVNQLKEILRWWHRDRARNNSTRHSALQVSCYDPAKDHTGSAQGGFPCLHHVSFSYDTQSQSLCVAGYYPTQFVFYRGYGNYLGLCRLGQFMANEMGLELTRLNCYVNYPLRHDVASRELCELAELVGQIVDQEAGTDG